MTLRRKAVVFDLTSYECVDTDRVLKDLLEIERELRIHHTEEYTKLRELKEEKVELTRGDIEEIGELISKKVFHSHLISERLLEKGINHIKDLVVDYLYEALYSSLFLNYKSGQEKDEAEIQNFKF